MSSDVTIVGNLFADPKQRNSDGETTRCTFSIASEEGTGDNKKTVPVNVTVFGKLAENILKSPGMKTGKSVIVVGRLASFKKPVQIEGEDKKIDMISVNAFHVGPDLLWQTVEVTKVTKSGSDSGNSGGQSADGGNSSAAAAKPAASDNADDF